MTVALPRWVGRLSVFLLCIFLGSSIQAQERVLTGKITDSKDGAPIIGATVTVKGTTIASSTEADGSFRLPGVPADAKTLVISSIGFGTREVAITGDVVSVTLTASNSDLNEVVVVGYGTSRKKDLTGAVASVKAKDFNKGVVTAPDQLLQGKVAGVQIMNNSGAPGAATTVRIRGNSSIRSGNQPLYVIDGVALDGRTARPGINAGGVGTIPGSNPLNFINNNDILSMEVLKDASAAAIYGSRGANGVILITTKKGATGQRVDVNASVGISSMMRQIEVLDGNEYRAALDKYGLTSGDYGDNVDAMDAITRNALTQNYSIGVSGGNENGKYRISASYLNQEGIILKSDFKKYTAGINGSFKFLENRRLGLDFNVTVGHNTENAAPISNDAGFTGSIVGQALQWNPTHPFRFRGSNGVDSLYLIPQFGNTSINPLVMSAAWDDISNTTNVLAYVAPSYNIAKGLDYRFLYSINHQVSTRKNQIRSYLNLENIQNRGLANQANGTLTTTQMTHTLNYIKEIGDNITITALGGYEFMKFRYLGNNVFGQDFANVSTPYYNYLQYTTQGSRQISSFDQTTELQSYFARAVLNYKDRYIFTGTFRADGSSKFGENNKYGYFPSLALAWNVHNEAFMADQSIFDQLKLRASWGQTGNQEFPAFASQETYIAGQQSFGLATIINNDLRWETSTTINIGLDFSVAKGRLIGSIDYFNKKTKDIIFDRDQPDPVPVGSPTTWLNLPGEILNAGVELFVNYQVVKNSNFSWDIGVNGTYLKNELRDFGILVIPTGGLSGQGISGTNIQRFVNNRPLHSYYLRDFSGIDRNGQATFVGGDAALYFIGDPNPDYLLGLTTNVGYKKFNLEISMNGAFGHQVYNNTANTVLPINNLGTRNIAKALMELNPSEALSSPITASTRYLESGDYMKLTNATLSYNLGDLGTVIKNANLFLTGQNLFVITGFSGFDPEVNVDKNVGGRPSFGIEYIPYPTARNFIFGINFSF
ncbi:SusC/RagA family TonB-linked outer membrane protein [Flavihumibacter sp. UBA7668]|uniref:SusC/RagA family TonB-linked outer membrane protein n=1 Tax=Flavihumibacter sp. UBA7668 TaxID=1946542 RepID=UPI0025BD752D|nr:SusC/RagA family TonB-linked outer membrane protein [Flavihumibacter sp. UBA7668]